MSDSQTVKGLLREREAASKVLADAPGKLAAAIGREVMARTPYTVLCDVDYDDGDGWFIIVHVFNVTSEQAGSDVRRLLHAIGVDNQCDVWTYSPDETKRLYPAHYKGEQP